MSDESNQVIKSRVEFFNTQSDRMEAEAAKDRQVSLRKLPFNPPVHSTPTVSNPTGNPLLFSPTGFVPGPQGKPAPKWLKHPAARS